MSGEEGFAWDWSNESTPLLAIGNGAPKFVSPGDKHSSNEGETAFIAFNVEGNPPPKVTWMRGFEDLGMKQQRYKMWTKGGQDENLVILGINQCKQEDDGEYKCALKNDSGEEVFDFRFFVTVEGGMDFRAMLLKRKKPAKKAPVPEVEWLETPIDVTVKEGKSEKVVFSARLSEKEKKGRWFLRNLKTQTDKMATENGLEITKKDESYEMTQEEDFYTLTILNPTVELGGRYTLQVKLEKDSKVTSAYLDVQEKDPEFFFTKKLASSVQGFTNRSVTFSCALNQSGASVKWKRNGSPINLSSGRYLCEGSGINFKLTITNCEMGDEGSYSCEILEFIKDGEDFSTDSTLIMQEYPHKFTSELIGQDVVENDQCAFEIEVEAEDAQVEWYHEGKLISADDPRFSIISNGKKRRLILKCAQLSDAGEICVKTNTQSSACQLNVCCENEIIVGLPSKIEVIERETMQMEVNVRDPAAPVTFSINDTLIDGQRFSAFDLGQGKHQVKLTNVKMEDEGILDMKTPSNRGENQLSSTCFVIVIKGEEAPQMGYCGPVTGIAHENCSWSIPFSVEGEKQSQLEIVVVKDGQELVLGKDINIGVEGDKIDLSVINPSRDKSGIYTVILRNAQGEVRKDINVNIWDKPTPPRDVKVTDVYRDNCIVHWRPPVDDGGTQIIDYLIEAIDLTSNCAQWNVIGQAKEQKFKAINLEEGHRYKFRVSAVNKLGQSAPCMIKGDGVLIKDPWDPPSPPGRPSVLDWSPEWAKMKWEPPESDGGAAITHYVIEMMEKTLGSWQTGDSVLVENLEHVNNGMLGGVCHGLVEGLAYTFRVKAVNKGGPSLPSLPSQPEIIAKNRSICPFVDKPGMYDITVKKGRPIVYDINVGGEPSPRITWHRDGKVLYPEYGILKIEEFRRGQVYTVINAVLSVEASQRERDKGQYTIRLESSSGIVESHGYVNVLDVPGPPRNFTVDKVFSNCVNFCWSAPHDDGGQPIKHYQIRFMDFETGDWHIAGDYGGLEGSVSGLKPGKCYEFEIVAINREGESLAMKIADPVFTWENVRKPDPPIDPRVIVSRSHEMLLQWTPPQFDGGSDLIGYVIEKKRYDESMWTSALDIPIWDCCHCQYWVPRLQTGKTYQFRVRAVNKLGASDPSQPSAPFLCNEADSAPKLDKTLEGSYIRRQNRPIEWRVQLYGGHPFPRIVWAKDDGKLASSANCFTETQSNGTIAACFSLSRCKKSDAGHYKLTVENALGSDTLGIDLIVLDDLDGCECTMFKRADLSCPCRFRQRKSFSMGEFLLMMQMIEEME